MNAHTPGPWKLDVYRARNGDPCARVLANDGSTSVADCSFVVEEYEKANAALIAAAPDLLKACKGLLAVIAEYQTGGEQTPYPRIDAAKAAIAKAVRATSQPSDPGAGGHHGL